MNDLHQESKIAKGDRLRFIIVGAFLAFSTGCVPIKDSSRCTITLRVPHAKAPVSVTDPEIQSAVGKINAALILKGFSCTFANLKTPVQGGYVANYQAGTVICRVFLKDDAIQIIFSDFIRDLDQQSTPDVSNPCNAVFVQLTKWYGDKWVKMEK